VPEARKRAPAVGEVVWVGAAPRRSFTGVTRGVTVTPLPAIVVEVEGDGATPPPLTLYVFGDGCSLPMRSVPHAPDLTVDHWSWPAA